MRVFATGKLYFLIKFLDPDLTVPIVRTLRFSKRTKSSDGRDMLIFEQLTDDGGAEKIALHESDADHVAVDPDELLRRLEKCFQGILSKVD